MSLFARRKPQAVEETAGGESSNESDAEGVAGERTLPSINRRRSLQSRVSSALAIALIAALGIAVLTWYYSNAFTRQSRAADTIKKATQARVKGEMPLPPLGPVEAPHASTAPTEPPAIETVLGPPPPLPDPAGEAPWRQSDALLLQATSPHAGVSAKTPGQAAFERRLSGAVFARAGGAAPESVAQVHPANTNDALGAGESLAGLLQPTTTAAVVAHQLSTREFLLAKGAFIDCTLETAIDSTLPGMVTCITATDTFGSDGRIVLLERGTKLVGETRGQVQQGAARLFVLWTEARTPTGVIVPIASPGTDELGRSGLPGTVDRHFWDRFGAAILISIVNGAVQGAAQSGSGEGTIIVNPSVSSDVMTEVLRSTIAIRPTIRKAQGDRIQVLVARDVDFRSVYALHTAGNPSGTP